MSQASRCNLQEKMKPVDTKLQFPGLRANPRAILLVLRQVNCLISIKYNFNFTDNIYCCRGNESSKVYRIYRTSIYSNALIFYSSKLQH